MATRRQVDRCESWRPSEMQDLLLRSAVLSGESASAAWRQWKNRADIDRLDWNSQRLLPLVHANLEHLDPADPLMPRLQSVRRKTWYKNHMLLAMAGPVFDAFEKAEVKAMLLKGPALVLTVYGDYSLRPFEDIDILISPKDVEAAGIILSRLGWRPRRPPRYPLDFYGLWAKHALAYAHDSGGQIDLHWHVDKIHGPHGPNETLHVRARVVQEGRRPLRVLDPENQLLHILGHGTGDRRAPIRWIPDSLHLLRASSSEINWRQVIEIAASRRMILRVRTLLFYLKDHFEADIPEDVLPAMRREPVSDLEYRYERRTARGGGIRHRMTLHFVRPALSLSFHPNPQTSFMTLAFRYWKLWSAWHDIRFIWEIPWIFSGLILRFLKRMLSTR